MGGDINVIESPGVGPPTEAPAVKATDCGNAVSVAVTSSAEERSEPGSSGSFSFELGGQRTGEAEVKCFSSSTTASCCNGGNSWNLAADRASKSGSLSADPTAQNAGPVTVTCQAHESGKCVGEVSMTCQQGKCTSSDDSSTKNAGRRLRLQIQARRLKHQR